MSLSRVWCFAAVVWLSAAPAFALPPALPRSDDPAVQAFLSNDLERALPMLLKSARQSPMDADAHAWLASCQRRLGQYDDAERSARRALALDPRHAFAHQVLGDTYNPVYSGWEHTDAESSWTHLRLSVAGDPNFGDAWAGLWIPAMQRGDSALEKQSLRSLVSTGFLTPGMLAYSRWVLRSLPERAAIVCNGDMDTYPLVALQETEGLRTDVVVLNVGLLDLPWYRRLMHARHGLPMPTEDDLAPGQTADGGNVTSYQKLLGAWVDTVATGRFGRPFTTAVTLTVDSFLPGHPRRDVLAGPFWEHPPGPIESGVDTARARASLQRIDRAAAAQTYVAAGDHSPLRRVFTNDMHDNIANVARLYVAEVRKTKDEARVQAALVWARQLALETGASAALLRGFQPHGADEGGKE